MTPMTKSINQSINQVTRKPKHHLEGKATPAGYEQLNNFFCSIYSTFAFY